MVKYCQNRYCDNPDEPMERYGIDYKMVNGAVMCCGCIEFEEDNEEFLKANHELALPLDAVTQILWDRSHR